MALFGTTAGSGLSVDVPPYRVYVAPVTPNGASDPTWGGFQEDQRLKVVSMFKGSSVAGMSRGKLTLAVGAPFTSPSTQRVESFDVLHQGDRVIIGQGRGSNVTMLWAGYMTGAQLNIAAESEGIGFNLHGPEWMIAGRPGAGTWKCVTGQIRRKGPADDKFFNAKKLVSDKVDLGQFTDERAVFNPDGRQNRTKDKVNLTTPGSADPTTGAVPAAKDGYCWEIPDRKIFGSTSVYVKHWTKLDALQTLWLWYNDPTVTGIQHPNWTAIGAILNSGPTDQVLRSVDVDGLGLWEASIKILGPEFGCYVTPLPVGSQSANAPTWDGFEFHVFERGTGPSATASVVLNPFGTPAIKAKPGVVRMEVAKDIAKTVNKVRVYGKLIRHIKLKYSGSDTPTIAGDNTDPLYNISLQQGWKKSEGDLDDYSVENTDTNEYEITRASIESVSPTLQDHWRDRYHAKGKQFEKYKHVFRLFVWNEAGEFPTINDDPDCPAYGQYSNPAETQKWWNPDLTLIASDSGTDNDGVDYCRRKRKLLDTAYKDGTIDGWRRVPPTLYIAGQGNGTQGQWTKVEKGFFRFDPERAAIWITVNDISAWQPLVHLPHPDEPTTPDARTFATLLGNGDLRLLIEASIECDWAFDQTVDRTDVSGSPLVREMILRRPSDFVMSLKYADGITSPMNLTADLIDDTDDALQLATQTQAGLQDQETHASIMLSADAVEVPIGSMLSSTSGRQINLTSDAKGTRGSQIVGLTLDPLSNKWELLTESAVLRLGARARKKVGRKKMFHPKVPGVPGPLQQTSGDGPAAPGPMEGLA